MTLRDSIALCCISQPHWGQAYSLVTASVTAVSGVAAVLTGQTRD